MEHSPARVFLRGKLLTEGTVDEVIEKVHFSTWSASGPELLDLAEQLRDRPGVEQAAPFGNELHVSGGDAAALEQAIAPFRKEPHHWQQIDSGLEDIFIHLMAKSRNGKSLMKDRRGFSSRRLWAVVVKEFIQMRRDRFTFAMMVGVPLMQLVLFGYAINADPKHLPAAVLLGDHGPYGRTLLNAIQNSGYYNFVRLVQTEAEGEALLAHGAVQFVVNSSRRSSFFASP